MGSKKKIMIIGAGAGQVPIIEMAKKRGFETLVVSPNGPYPGILIADKHIQEDIYNTDKLVDIGKKEGISYVISDQSDYAVPLVAYIANKLGLPGNPIEVAQTYAFKDMFRHFCHLNGLPAPKSMMIKPEHYFAGICNHMTFPLVVKPADSQGSRGINKVIEIEDLQSAITDAAKYSRNGHVVIEEFFEGKELVVEGFVIEGEYYHVAIGDRIYFDIPNRFIPSKTIFPSSANGHLTEKIISNEKKIASLLKPRFGIVHSEYLVNDKGEFIVIESALRGGGVYIASHLVPMTTGVNLTEMLIDAMLGENAKLKENLSPASNGYSEYICFYLKEGVVTEIMGQDKIKEIPGVILADIDNIKIGDQIEKFEHKGQRKGPILIFSKSLDGLQDIKVKIRRSFQVMIDNSPGIRWD